MAKKESRISINKLESVLKENIITVPMRGNEEVTITIRRTLPLKDMMQFVQNVVSSCIDKEKSEYVPEIKNFAIRSEVLTNYANFNMPSNVEKQYELVYCTDVYNQVIEHIDTRQLAEIEDAIDSHIDHEIKMIQSVVATKTNELLLRVEEMIEQFSNIFGGINSDDFNGVVKKLSEMDGITEESIAKAVLGVQRDEQEVSGDDEGKVIAINRDDA